MTIRTELAAGRGGQGRWKWGLGVGKASGEDMEDPGPHMVLTPTGPEGRPAQRAEGFSQPDVGGHLKPGDPPTLP